MSQSDENAVSESQFGIFAQAMPNHVWTAQPDGQLDWFNDRTIEYGGMDADALKGDGWGELVHPDDIGEAAAKWQVSICAGATYEDEFRLRRADGAFRWHLVRAVPIRDGDDRITHWIGSNTDIHEQKLAETESTRDRDRLWTLSRDIMLVCELSGEICSVNPSATRLLDFAEDEIVERFVADFVHPDDLAATAAEMAKLADGATTLAFQSRCRTRTGDYRLLDWTVVPDDGRIHAVGRDITEEERLTRDRERIWKLSPIAKLVAKPDSTVVAVNPSWTKTLGWSADETIGKRLIDFVAPSFRAESVAALEQLAKTGEAITETERVLPDRDGKEHRFAWTTVPEGDMLYLFGRDITAETEAAETLAATEEALRQSQKMEAVGQLTGGIAHDFNNLLQGITGSLEIIQRRIAEGRLDDIERFMTGATGAANRAAALTHRRLAFSRRQPLDPRAVEVNPLLASMEDLLCRTIGERIEFLFVPGGDLWLTRCDPNQLENAVLNLVINARDAMPLGGKLTIVTSNAPLDDADIAHQRDIRPGEYVCLCVTDTGSGMSPEVIARAFEPFFTTKPIGQGTGLGLSMIYGFARQSEGYARIYSDADQGTTIKLYLPRYRGDELPDKPAVASIALSATHGETVLVVEDDPVVREMTLEVLSELGYVTLDAATGPAGVEVLRSSRHIDLLITDIGLPGLNGRQVADAGRIARPGLRILFMTGYAENAALAAGFLEPGMSMITKPFAIDALATRIRAMLEA